MTAPFPRGDRSIAPDDRGYPGMIQVEVNGHCFQVCANTPEAREAVIQHAMAMEAKGE